MAAAGAARYVLPLSDAQRGQVAEAKVEWLVSLAESECSTFRDRAVTAEAKLAASEANAERVFNDLERRFMSLSEEHTLLQQQHASAKKELADLGARHSSASPQQLSRINLHLLTLRGVLPHHTEARRSTQARELSTARNDLERSARDLADTRVALQRSTDALRLEQQRAATLQEQLDRHKGTHSLTHSLTAIHTLNTHTRLTPLPFLLYSGG